jgi:Ca2+-binding EF-hand superfamily protein
MLRLVLVFVLSSASLAHAQFAPALYPFSGTPTTSARAVLERSGPRPAGPRADVRSGFAVGATHHRRYSTFRLAPEAREIAQTQDLIVFTRTRPIRARLRVHAAGGDLAGAWRDQLRRYFDFLDRDGNGVLNPFEADFLMPLKRVQSLIESGTFSGLNALTPPFKTLDRDADGEVSFDEFLAFYASTAAGTLRIFPHDSVDSQAGRLNDAIFRLLDRDGDGRVSSSEARDAAATLAMIDRDGDELVIASELLPPTPETKERDYETFIKVEMNRKVDLVPGQPGKPLDAIMIHPPGSIPDAVIEQMLARYDRDKNLRLAKTEIAFEPATFAKLDKNGDGEIGIAELLAWRDLPPDAELELTAGIDVAGCAVRFHTSSPPAGFTLGKRDKRDILQFAGQSVEFEIVASPSTYSSRDGNMMELFNTASRDTPDTIREKDIQGGNFQPLRVIFDDADRDGDGNVTRQELRTFLDLRSSFSALPFAVLYSRERPNLFRLLDQDNDNRLSVRERRQAVERWKELLDANGELTRDALEPQPIVRFGRSSLLPMAVSIRGYEVAENRSTPSQGPLWFRRMDRNGDGDLSRSEFLGRDADFERLDLDRDGLISVSEAVEADKKFRSPEPPKK